MECKEFFAPNHFPIFYLGPDLSEGALPAFFYFSIAGDESLTLPPYNHPVLALLDAPLRIFSFTLPFHGASYNKFHAIEKWISHLHAKDPFLENFLTDAQNALSWLIDEGYVDPSHIAVGGLSRGGFIAAHLAARDHRIHTLLGFAPVTCLKDLADYQPYLQDKTFSSYLENLSLRSLKHSLLHLHSLRFYMGNRDTQVNTDTAYQFVRLLADAAHLQHKRNVCFEFFMTQSIGLHGHGTRPEIFEEGALWIKKLLLR